MARAFAKAHPEEASAIAMSGYLKEIWEKGNRNG